MVHIANKEERKEKEKQEEKKNNVRIFPFGPGRILRCPKIGAAARGAAADELAGAVPPARGADAPVAAFYSNPNLEEFIAIYSNLTHFLLNVRNFMTPA